MQPVVGLTEAKNWWAIYRDEDGQLGFTRVAFFAIRGSGSAVGFVAKGRELNPAPNDPLFFCYVYAEDENEAESLGLYFIRPAVEAKITHLSNGEE
jgi:hypothetical protein